MVRLNRSTDGKSVLHISVDTYITDATHTSSFVGMSATRVHQRHISSAVMECQPIGFTHRRIRRASPLASSHPVSPIHSHRSVSLCIMHVPESGIERHTYFALLVCRTLGFAHSRIHRASPLVSCHPVSTIHSTRRVSLSIMHVHCRAAHMDADFLNLVFTHIIDVCTKCQ